MPPPVNPVLSRRRVLVAAATGTAGAALMTLPEFGALSARTTRAAAAGMATPWHSPLHTPQGRSAHLLRRAGFGYSAAELDAASAMPYHDLVESVVTQAPQAPTFSSADQQCGRWNAGPAWFDHLATTAAQFPERMALFWHGILTSESASTPFEFNYMTVQNRTFREYGRGDLRTLLIETALSAAMMHYLNLQQSSAGGPNENFARELMELFTLGPGAYTETDVREGARALTGYRVAAYDRYGNAQPWPKWFSPQNSYTAQIRSLIGQGWTWRGALQPQLHDSGVKSFLGRSGNFALEDIVDIILQQPSCASFIATKAIRYFAGATAAADTGFVNAVATSLRNSNYDISTMMRTIFLGGDSFAATAPVLNRFLQPDCYRSIIRNPADFVLASIRATGYVQSGMDSYSQCEAMGMSIYAPPNVAGWHGDAAWLSSSAWLMRMNVASNFSWRNNHPELNPDPTANLAAQLDGVLSPATQATYAGATSAAARWSVLLASPEFNLK